MGFGNFLSKIFGNKAQRDRELIQPYINKIELIYPSIQALSNDELRGRTEEIKQKIQDYVSVETKEIADLKSQIESQEIEQREKTYAQIDKLSKLKLDKYEEVLTEVLPEVFAIVKDTARRFTEQKEVVVTATDLDREFADKFDFVDIDGDKAVYHNEWQAGGNPTVWNMIHYNVQLFGGVVLHQGKIAEMATGEGKTLVGTLPIFLNALTHNGVHVITVNDYLSKRDSEWMGPLYMFHGLTVDCIDKHRPNSDERRKAYMADITFGTNNEFGFDYLRDNMAGRVEELVQREHNYAIVDEVDSVLIDDARTPLIISGPMDSSKSNEQLFNEYKPRVEHLVNLQKVMATNYLTEAKRLLKESDKKSQEEGALALFRSYKALPKNQPLIKFLSEPGIKPLLLKTEEIYIAENNKRMPEATDPLYFVIDERHNSIVLTDKGVDALTGASEDPTFFVLPDIGSEMVDLEAMNLPSAELAEKKEQLIQNYAVKSERIHTINQLLKAYTLFIKDDQYVVIDGKVMIVDEQTGRIMDGRRYSDGLHQALEAKEGVQVEAATQTYATITLQNYFRMYHKLAGMTGTAETEAAEFWNIYKLDVVVIPTNRPIARIDMNDRIYRTQREKYNAVIEEIVSLTNQGRPVLVGTTSVEISELLSRMLRMRGIQHNVLNAKLHQKEAEIVAEAGKSKTVTIATNMAGRGTDIKLSQEIKDAGGLAIIGTERHESRRVDRQLRGRAGRQGDPGSSVFFVSLEDKLMRLFGSEKIAYLMEKMGVKDGEMIESNMVTKSIERAQKKVEENHFGVRKRLIEYDDVMNNQREVVYRRRRQTLRGERMGVNLMDMIYGVAQRIVGETKGMLGYSDFKNEVVRLLSFDTTIPENEYNSLKDVDLVQKLFEEAMATFKRRTEMIADQAYPVLKNIFDQHPEGGMVGVPITDGHFVYSIAVDLKEAVDCHCKNVVKEFERRTLLHAIDSKWKDHLREMDDLKNSVQNAHYEQKDPLVIYKIESYNMFAAMLDDMNQEAVNVLMRGQILMRQEDDAETQARIAEEAARRQALAEAKEAEERMKAMQMNRSEDLEEAPEEQSPLQQISQQKQMPANAGVKVGRNDPCPCGSGKKYKQCCGKNI